MVFFFPGEDRPVISPHDLRTASECEFALIRDLDGHLGRATRADEKRSDMMDRIIELGNAHENLERIRSAPSTRVGCATSPVASTRERVARPRWARPSQHSVGRGRPVPSDLLRR